jgi:serine phosphatase RsbU (regulator of sigma subunit)
MKITDNKIRKQIAIIILILLIASGLLNFAVASFSNRGGSVLSTIIVVVILLFLAIKIRNIYLFRKDEIIEKFEKQKGDVSVLDAFLYSLFSIKSIYTNIPDDHKKIINVVFILIGSALIFLLFHIGNLGTILLAGVIIGAAILILIRILTMEREEKNRLMDELKVAHDMQMSLLPKEPPKFYDTDIYGICLPAKYVGGDFFNYYLTDSNNLSISLTDVSGKGLDAAMTTLFFSGSLSAEIIHSSDCKNIMNNLNRVSLQHLKKGKFISSLLFKMDYENMEIHYINAGQPKPILKRDNIISILNSNGNNFPIGLVKEPNYKTESIKIKQNDIILIYTDGVNEAMNKYRNEYTNERLTSFILNIDTVTLSSKDIADSIINDIFNFKGEAEQHDDITLVVIKVL